MTRDAPEHIIRQDFPFAPVGVVRMYRGEHPVFVATFPPERWVAVCAGFKRATTDRFEVEWGGYTVVCAQS